MQSPEDPVCLCTREIQITYHRALLPTFRLWLIIVCAGLVLQPMNWLMIAIRTDGIRSVYYCYTNGMPVILIQSLQKDTSLNSWLCFLT
jgi:hypothetical protein